jgi:hypothetical protein
MAEDNSPIRICLFGLPRSGSQYISSIISKSVGGNMRNLTEPFTPHHPYNIAQHNGFLYTTSEFPKFKTYREQIDYVFDMLKSGNQNQSLVLKIFFTDKTIPLLGEFQDKLRELNFKFLIIKRENVEYHMLSWIVANATQKWSTRHGFHDSPVYITTEQMNSVKFLYESILNFDKAILDYNINANLIRYEHCIEDITEYLQYPINTDVDFKKQLPNNPYDIIENAKEVKEFLNTLTKL